MLDKIIKDIKDAKTLTHENITALLDSPDETLWAQVFERADDIRKKNFGDAVHLRGLLEFSNYCKRNCLYCGLRKDNKTQYRYRMPPDEIVENAVQIASFGIKTIVLQSGEDPYYTTDIICNILRDIKKNADTAITLSIGEKTRDEYKAFFDAGADRYLIRHETASPSLYASLHPDSTLKERLNCIDDLFSIGFQVGIGCMVGLPGQTHSDMAADILLLQEKQPDMIGMGPFICNQDTPLQGALSGTIEQTLKMTALARIVCPRSHLPATTATGSIDRFGREKALAVGANVVMPNFTPLNYRMHYTIYPNKRCITEDGYKCNTCIRKMIENEGRTVATGYGHSLRFESSTGQTS